MRNLLSTAVFIIYVLYGCTSSKKASGIHNNNLPSPDSFRTSDLFFLTPEKQLQYYQNIDRILPTNKIEAGARKYALTEASRDFSNFAFNYMDTLRTLTEFMEKTKTVGIIIIKNDSILYEQYLEGTGPATRWINFSVAKSITSLLYGAALQDGYIKSLDDKVTQYISDLKGSVYDSVSLRDLLQMSSGVAWDEDPRNPQSDLLKVGRMEGEKGWSGVIAYLSSLKRAAPPG